MSVDQLLDQELLQSGFSWLTATTLWLFRYHGQPHENVIQRIDRFEFSIMSLSTKAAGSNSNNWLFQGRSIVSQCSSRDSIWLSVAIPIEMPEFSHHCSFFPRVGRVHFGFLIHIKLMKVCCCTKHTYCTWWTIYSNWIISLLWPCWVNTLRVAIDQHICDIERIPRTSITSHRQRATFAATTSRLKFS